MGEIKLFEPKGKNATLEKPKLLACGAFTVDLLAGGKPWRGQRYEQNYSPSWQAESRVRTPTLRGLRTFCSSWKHWSNNFTPWRFCELSGITTIMVIYWQVIMATGTLELLSIIKWCLTHVKYTDINNNTRWYGALAVIMSPLETKGSSNRQQ